MRVFNSFQELMAGATVGGQSPGMMYTNTNNANFSGMVGLTQEQRVEVEFLMEAVLKVERDFRSDDDKYLEQEKRDMKALADARSKLKATRGARIIAAHDFEKIKSGLEAPLKPYGITVVWDEPQVDAVHLDVDT